MNLSPFIFLTPSVKDIVRCTSTVRATMTLINKMEIPPYPKYAVVKQTTSSAVQSLVSFAVATKVLYQAVRRVQDDCHCHLVALVSMAVWAEPPQL